MGLVNQRLKGLENGIAHAQARQRELGFALVQQPQHGPLAVGAGQGGHAHVDRTTSDAQRYAAVLRQAFFGDVEFGHDLQARDQGGMQGAVGLHHFTQGTVYPKANRTGPLIGFDVDVAGPVLGGLCEQGIEHADDGSVVGRFQQIFHRRKILQQAREVDGAFQFTHHCGGIATAARIGLCHPAVQGRIVHFFDHIVGVQAAHLRQARPNGALGHPQRTPRSLLFEEHALRLRKPVGQWIPKGHRRPLQRAGGTGEGVVGRSGRSWSPIRLGPPGAICTCWARIAS